MTGYTSAYKNINIALLSYNKKYKNNVFIN